MENRVAITRGRNYIEDEDYTEDQDCTEGQGLVRGACDGNERNLWVYFRVSWIIGLIRNKQKEAEICSAECT